MFKGSDLLSGARLAALLLCGCLIVTGCCPNCPGSTPPGPPNTQPPPNNPSGSNPPGPPNFPPEMLLNWQGILMNGNTADLIKSTGQIIAEGDKSAGYADAYLYRGLAKYSQGDLQGAQADLRMAEKLKDGFSSKFANQEQALLYRGLMVVSAKLGQADSANAYLNQAVALAPDQADSINRELNGQVLMLAPLSP